MAELKLELSDFFQAPTLLLSSINHGECTYARLLETFASHTGFPKGLTEVVLRYCSLSPFELAQGRAAEWHGADDGCSSALVYYTRAVDQKSAEAMCRLAQFHMFGFGATKVDWKRAEELLNSSKELGYADAELWLHLLACERTNYAKSPSVLRKAIAAWETMAEQRNDAVAYALSRLGKDLLSTKKKSSAAEAKSVLPAVLTQYLQGSGDWAGTLNWLVGCFEMDASKNYTRGRNYLDAAATSKHAGASWGLVRQGGKGVRERIAILKEIAEKYQYPPAYWTLGSLHLTGLGLFRNRPQAFKWFMQAAELGFAPAMNNVGKMYLKGNGVEQDYALAYKWRQMALEQGNNSAIRNLGGMYRDGKGVPQDSKKALELFLQAGEDGSKSAMREAAVCYATGNGVTADEEKSRELYRRAAKAGDRRSKIRVRGWQTGLD